MLRCLTLEVLVVLLHLDLLDIGVWFDARCIFRALLFPLMLLTCRLTFRLEISGTFCLVCCDSRVFCFLKWFDLNGATFMVLNAC